MVSWGELRREVKTTGLRRGGGDVLFAGRGEEGAGSGRNHNYWKIYFEGHRKGVFWIPKVIKMGWRLPLSYETELETRHLGI